MTTVNLFPLRFMGTDSYKTLHEALITSGSAITLRESICHRTMEIKSFVCMRC